MKHNDYLQAMKCKVCGAGIYIPVVWSSKKFKRPSYPTCSHVKREEIQKVTP